MYLSVTLSKPCCRNNIDLLQEYWLIYYKNIYLLQEYRLIARILTYYKNIDLLQGYW
jgi:hypothetical protein